MDDSLFLFFDKAPFLISLLAGILTFISPCILPLVPAYLSYVSGISLGQLKQGDELTFSKRLKILKSSGFFILGFSLVFIVLGVGMARILNVSFLHLAWSKYFAGGILIVFGLHIARIMPLRLLDYQKSVNLKTKYAWLEEAFAPFLLGVSFALGWSPCIGPIFAGIISLAGIQETFGITLIIIYTFGLALSFFVTALLIGHAFSFFDKIKAHYALIERISGGLLIVIGLLVATGGLEKISIWLVWMMA